MRLLLNAILAFLENPAYAAWFTAAVVILYTIETYKMRKQIVVQNARSVMPFVTVDFQRDQMFIQNIGMSPALNLTIDNLLLEENLGSGVGFAMAPSLAPSEGPVPMSFDTLIKGVPYSGQPWIRNFFPRLTERERRLIFRFQTIEGKNYKQEVVVRPQASSLKPVEVTPVKPDDKPILERYLEFLSKDTWGQE